ncbi:MAG: short-chain dehydrogenase, partial [Clostridiales bacterium]
LPFPKQKPDLVVKKILQGLEKGKKSVFPSHLFKIALLLDRIFPFIMPLYGRNEKRKFKNWQKNK